MLGTGIIFIQSIICGVIAYQSYQNSKTEHFHKGLVYMARFFVYIAVYLATTAVVSLLASTLTHPILTLAIYIPRLLLIMAYIHLLRTPIFRRFNFVTKRLKLFDTLLWASAIAAIVIVYFDFREASIINGTIINNLNIYAAISIGISSLVLGLTAAYSFMTLNKQDLPEIYLRNTYLLGIGAALLGVGDFIFMLSRNLTVSLMSDITVAIGFLLMVIVTITNYLRNKKKTQLNNKAVTT